MDNDTIQEISKLVEKLTSKQLKELKDYLHNLIYMK